jgi:hypothetical protein
VKTPISALFCALFFSLSAHASTLQCGSVDFSPDQIKGSGEVDINVSITVQDSFLLFFHHAGRHTTDGTGKREACGNGCYSVTGDFPELDNGSVYLRTRRSSDGIVADITLATGDGRSNTQHGVPCELK